MHTRELKKYEDVFVTYLKECTLKKPIGCRNKWRTLLYVVLTYVLRTTCVSGVNKRVCGTNKRVVVSTNVCVAPTHTLAQHIAKYAICSCNLLVFSVWTPFTMLLFEPDLISLPLLTFENVTCYAHWAKYNTNKAKYYSPGRILVV